METIQKPDPGGSKRTLTDSLKWFNTLLLSVVSFFLIVFFQDVRKISDTQTDILIKVNEFQLMESIGVQRMDKLEAKIEELEDVLQAHQMASKLK